MALALRATLNLLAKTARFITGSSVDNGLLLEDDDSFILLEDDESVLLLE